MAQCTSFLEKSAPPQSAKKIAVAGSSPGSSKAKEAAQEDLPPYDPGTFAPGQGYVDGSQSKQQGGKIVLIDEEDGSVLGELGEGYQVVADHALQAGSKGLQFTVSQASTRTLTSSRSRRDHIAVRGPRHPGCCARVQGVSGDGASPRLPEILHRFQGCICLTFDRDYFGFPVQGHADGSG